MGKYQDPVEKEYIYTLEKENTQLTIKVEQQQKTLSYLQNRLEELRSINESETREIIRLKRTHTVKTMIIAFLAAWIVGSTLFILLQQLTTT